MPTPGRRGAWGPAVWLALWFSSSVAVLGATLSNPVVDAFNLRVGTQTFAGQYRFTTNTLLVETALAIQGMGSDIVKFYMGRDFPRQYGIALLSQVTNLATLARDEPSCRRVLDMPFRHVLVWAYCFATGGDAYWADGMSAAERQREYAELHAFARHLLTGYSGSGKSFYLGHWEGDWYLLPGYVTTTNPSATAIQGMRDWLNTRQQAVDDARRDTPHTNVDVYVYAEVNRVRDAMMNRPGSNRRVVNHVLPAVTNLDFVSWSSYDGQDLEPAELHRTLDYIESQLPTNKAAVIPARRVFVGEYGWGGSHASTAQEPLTRAYIRNLLEWGARFVLFWQIYNNEPGRSFWLVDSRETLTPCYHLHARFLNRARLTVAQFHQDRRRLPDDAEYAALMAPLLRTAFSVPASLTVSNEPALEVGANGARVRARLVQGVYGEDQARVWFHWGRQDAGTNATEWEHAVALGPNVRFGPVTFATALAGLEPGTQYFYRARAVNNRAESWADTSATFTTALPAPLLRDGRVRQGAWQFRIGDNAAGTVAARCSIQAATNLISPVAWLTVWSAHAVTMPFAWVDPEPVAFPHRFYRVVFDP